METVVIRFETPQDFQGFRKLYQEAVVSYSIANLEVVCHCEKEQIATAISKFGGSIKSEK